MRINFEEWRFFSDLGFALGTGIGDLDWALGLEIGIGEQDWGLGLGTRIRERDRDFD